MTVVIAPGPARSGMPMGTTATSSRSGVSSRSCAVSRERDRSPWRISRATPNRRMPPAILNAGIVKPKPAKSPRPKGSTVAQMGAMEVPPSAKPPMVCPGFRRSVLPHQLHPAAALVHGEVAAVCRPDEFVPGDDLELVAAPLREAQRARAPHLARLESLHGSDLPCILERNLFECRHGPSLSAPPSGGGLTAVRQCIYKWLSFVCRTLTMPSIPRKS